MSGAGFGADCDALEVELHNAGFSIDEGHFDAAHACLKEVISLRARLAAAEAQLATTTYRADTSEAWTKTCEAREAEAVKARDNLRELLEQDCDGIGCPHTTAAEARVKALETALRGLFANGGGVPSAYTAQASPDEVVTRAFEEDRIRLKRELESARAAMRLAMECIKKRCPDHDLEHMDGNGCRHTTRELTTIAALAAELAT